MRVLIATATAGGGHLQAAAALNEAWKALRPADTVEMVDLLDFVPKLQRKAYADGFLFLVSHAPELWGMIFKKTDRPSRAGKITRVRRTIARYSNQAFGRYLRRFQPEIVVGTHFLPLEIMGSWASQGQGQPPFTVGVVTDFEAHAFWIEPAVNLYCVAAPETRASLAGRGVPAESIQVTGIPIASRFADPPDLTRVRRRYGWREDLPMLLVLGGGFGMGPVAEILVQLDTIEDPFQMAVIAGRNAELRRDLGGAEYRHPTDVLGFVTNMNEFMAAADLIVSKPGGLTVSEALALGKPMVIINPIPGQETANSDFLLEHGAAIKVNRVEDLPARISTLLGSARLKEMSRAAKALGRPKAAQDICETILQRFAPEKPE